MSQRNVKEDMSEWPDATSHRLIRHAARRAPESLRERLEEEWLADWAARRSPMSRLRFAIGCCWATRVIAHEHQLSLVPVLAVASARHWGPFSRRSGTLFMIASLHAALLYGLITTLMYVPRPAIPTPLQNHVLDTARPKDLPLPPPQTRWTEGKIIVPNIDVKVPRQPDAERDVTTDTKEMPPEPPVSATPPHVVNLVQGGPGAGFPNPDDFYPMLSRHLEEQGTSTVRVCVDVNGRLTADPTTVQGTGNARLDEGALKLARAGSGHYRASTEDGRPVNSCYPFRIRFQIKN